MKLHYSQTQVQGRPQPSPVSVPYEITLLSNGGYVYFKVIFVSVPYEITLLSNIYQPADTVFFVSVPYEITLLSNKDIRVNVKRVFQYLMKLHYSQTGFWEWARSGAVSVPYEITLLSNRVSSIWGGVVFQYLMKLHYSQTRLNIQYVLK